MACFQAVRKPVTFDKIYSLGGTQPCALPAFDMADGQPSPEEHEVSDCKSKYNNGQKQGNRFPNNERTEKGNRFPKWNGYVSLYLVLLVMVYMVIY